MQKLKKHILFALFVFNAILAQAQNSNYHTVWFSADNNSLPQNSVKSITKDKSGFIWLSTENGLVRFDGQRFYTFNSENVPRIKSNRTRHFYGNPNLDTIYIKNDVGQYLSIINRGVSVIAESKIPKKFKSSYYALDKTQSAFGYENIFLKNNSFYKTTPDSIYFINEKNTTLYRNSIFTKKSHLLFSINGSIFISEDKKDFFRVAPNGRIFNSFFNDTLKIDQIYRNQIAHQAFIKSGKNLYLLKFKNNKLSPRLVYSDLNEKENILSIYFDADTNILYLGSASKGLLVVKNKKFQAPVSENSNSVYYAQIPFGENNSLTSTGEVFKKNGASQTINLNVKNDSYILIQDKKGNLWSKDNNVLIQYTKESNFKKTKKWYFKHRITEIIELKNGQIIVSTSIKEQQSGEIFKLDQNSSNTFFLKLKVDFRTTFMAEGSNDIIWTASTSGLHKINLNLNKAENLGPSTTTYVRNIYAKNDDEIWFSTYDSGIYLFRPSTKKTTHFPIDNNKFLLSAHCFVEDANGYFWIPTNKGLFQVLKKNLLDFEANNSKSVYYHYYDKTNGFNTNEFNGGCHPCGFLLENGEITFPSMEGIVYFDPLKIAPICPTNDIYFDDVKVDGQKINIVNKTLTLNYNFERLIFSVTSPYFGNKENLNIEIKLEGPQSQNWIRVEDQSVTFSSLPPGQYVLTARKLNGFDSNFQYSTLKISIPPPFWKTFWFKIIFIILGSIIIYYSIKIRIRYIKNKNKMLQIQIAEKTSQLRKTIKSLKKTEQRLSLEIINHKKLIGQITHDIKSPLRYLALTGKYVYQNINKEEDLTEEIKSIYTSSIQIYNFVESILEYAKTNEKETISEFNLRELVKEKTMLFKNLATSQETQIINLISQKEMVQNNRFLLSIIIHNFLDNAVKNTVNGKIYFRSKITENRLFITIEDTGKGIDKEKVDFYNKLIKEEPIDNIEKSGMGLKIIRELLLIIRGEMHIKSTKNIGTEITISIPIARKV